MMNLTPVNTDPPLYVALKPSRRFALGLGLAHLAAAAAIVATGLPLWLALAAGSALLVHGVVVIARTALLRSRGAVVALEAGRGETLPFMTRDGVWHEGRILGSTYVAPYLTVLNISDYGSRRAYHVPIMPDGIDPEDFRRLRVWLRWGAPKTV